MVTEHPFPPTAWTVVFAARDSSPPAADAAREALFKAYWEPVVSYLRALGLSIDDAKDEAQELMSRVCRDGVLTQLDPAKGRLRHFFKAAARNQAHNHHRDQTAKKRGDPSVREAFDELPDCALPVTAAAPEALFDRQWAETIFHRAMHWLEESYALRGKGALLAALKPALISAGEVQPYAALSFELGVTESQIKVEVHRLRRRLAERLRAETASTLGPEATISEIEEELRYLVRTLAYEPSH